MRGRDLLIVAVLVLVLGGTVVKRAADRDTVRRTFADWAARGGLDPDLVLAIVEVESRGDLGAVNLTGPDGARGGSFGPTQISAKTARAYGFTGDPWDFTRNVNLAAEWTVKILRARPGGPPSTVDEVAAWWNAGRTSMTKVAPESSAWEYRDNLAGAYQEIIA